MKSVIALTLAGLSLSGPTRANAQLPPVHSVVTLSYHHYSSPGVPEWVLAGSAPAPARHRELQSMRPSGCTVTGQVQVLIGDERRERRRFTFVGAQIVEGISERRATLGFPTTNGIEWHEAFAVPPNVASTSLGREIVAFEGRIYGYRVERIVSSERAEGGRFPIGCGANTPLVAPPRDGFLHCFANTMVTSTWDGRSSPGAPRLASYRTRLHANGAAHEVSGRFIRSLEGRAGRILIVHDGQAVRAHAVH